MGRQIAPCGGRCLRLNHHPKADVVGTPLRLVPVPAGRPAGQAVVAPSAAPAHPRKGAVPVHRPLGGQAGRRVSVFRIDPGTGERLGLLATATAGEGGWVELTEPITVKAGEAFVAVPEF